MVREFLSGALLIACPGCSLLLDFSDSAGPDVKPDASYTQAACDYLEPNDTAATAMTIDPFNDTGPAAICPGVTVDEDWYKFTLPSTAVGLVVEIQFVNAAGDLDLQLLAATDPATPVAQSRGFADGETISCPSSTTPGCPMLTPGDYLFRVFPSDAHQLNQYTFRVTFALAATRGTSS